MSRGTAPNRFGLRTDRAVTGVLLGASVRVGLNRLRAATTLYALAGVFAVSVTVDVAGPAARRPPTGRGIGATNWWTRDTISSAASAANAKFRATNLLALTLSPSRPAE